MLYSSLGDKTIQIWNDKLNSNSTFNSLSSAEKLLYLNRGQQDCARISSINNLEPYKVDSNNGLHLIQSYSAQIFQYYVFSGGIHGQAFIGDGRPLSKLQFLLETYGSPGGLCVAHLYAHQGTFGVSGIPLCASLIDSDPVDILATIPPYPTPKYITFQFTPETYILKRGTPYILAIEYDGGGIYDYIMLNTGDLGIPTGYGNYVYLNSGVWHSINRVADFRVYTFRN